MDERIRSGFRVKPETGIRMRAVRFGAVALGIASLTSMVALIGCEDPGSSPVTMPKAVCEDPSKVALTGFTPTSHSSLVKVRGTLDSLKTKWAGGDSVSAFFGGKEIKLVFTLKGVMYMLTYADGKPVLTRMSHGDEGQFKGEGAIISPLLSPDGKKIVYTGTPKGKPAFIQDAVPGTAEGARVTLDPIRVHVTADPHWYSEGGKTYIYFSTLANLLFYNKPCGVMPGNTYRKEVMGDTGVGPFEPTGISGAYRGGISKDGQWAGT
jgi:WD40-like Beta Propeller Repeat